MTVKDVYIAILVELNKVEAPALLIEDFNYFLNKAINAIVFDMVTLADMDQRQSDNLEVLKRTFECDSFTEPYLDGPQGTCQQAEMPDDYLRAINCLVEFKRKTLDNVSLCDLNSAPNTIHSPARRMTSDMYSSIMKNVFLKPTVKRPYFLFHTKEGTVINDSTSTVNGDRYNRPSKSNIEIRYEKNSKYEINKIYVDYIRMPRLLELTIDDVESDIDTTLALEFTRETSYKIINKLLTYLLETTGDGRLQSNAQINTQQDMLGMGNK